MSQVKMAAKTTGEMCRAMLRRMEETLPTKPDIICTPEVFPFVGLPGGRPPLAECAEDRTGPVLDLFAAFARKHSCYVICSTYTVEKGRYYNAAVLFDREGRYVGEYRKINPTDDEMEKGITPGPLDPPVFKTDFGTIGIQICYDVNWYENWTKLARSGAKIVFWPSAFGGGMMLNSLAWMNRYYVVTSTRFEHPTKIVDPLGVDVVFTGRAGNWVCAPVNMDYAVVQTVKYFEAFREIRKKYGRAFRFRILHVEALALVENTAPELSVAAVLKEFGIPSSLEMIEAATRRQNAKRAGVEEGAAAHR
jgi:predicted amidohydrolase